MAQPPKVSVVVPHYRDVAGLNRCLEAMAVQTWPHPFEIVVADNNSPEGEAWVREAIAGRAKLVVVTEKGAGPARNGGVAVATGDVLAFTDCDCVPEPQWLEEGLEALKTADFVGGGVRVLVDDPLRITPVEAFERVFAFDMRHYAEKLGFAGSGNLFVSREVFEAVGGFRPAVSEDRDFSWRATSMGYRLGYRDEARVGHPARKTWPELAAKWRRVNRESYALAADKGQTWKWALRNTLLIPSIAAHAPKVLASKDLLSPGQKLAALGVLAQSRIWRTGDVLKILTTGEKFAAPAADGGAVKVAKAA